MEGDLIPFLTMVIVLLGYAGMNIISKLAMNSGMNPFCPCCLPPSICYGGNSSFCLFHGEENTTENDTIDLFPDFLMFHIRGYCEPNHIFCGTEELNSNYCMCFEQYQSCSHVYHGCSIWTKVSQKYEAPYSSSALMCLMASVQCVIVAFSFDHSLSAWSLHSSIRIVSSVYSGIVCSALAFCLMSWCIERKGPLYVSVFSPLLLIIVAIFSWALLDEKLYAGTIAGSSLIVLGLYGVLWGKKREMCCIDEKGTQIGIYDLESLSTNQQKLGIHTFHVTS